MDIEYVEILTVEIFRQLWLLKKTSFINQFVQPLGGEGVRWGINGRGIVILNSWEYHFIREHKNQVLGKKIYETEDINTSSNIY